MLFAFDSITSRYKTQEMHDISVSGDPVLIAYCSDKYKTQRMCDETVHDFLAASELIRDWFVTSKMIKELYTALYADENILYFTEDSVNVVFSCYEMGILNIDLNNINLHNSLYEYDPETILLIRLLARDFKFGKRKALIEKISEELIPIAWYPKQWQTFCMSEDKKNETEPTFTQ